MDLCRLHTSARKLNAGGKYPLFLNLWALFGLSRLTSALVHGELGMVAQAIWFLLGVPLLYFDMLPRLLRGKRLPTDHRGVAFEHVDPVRCFPAPGACGNRQLLRRF